MRKINMLLLFAFLFACSIVGPQCSKPSSTFTLKFINTGPLSVTGFYLNQENDSINWGSNILPVDSLTTNEYVLLHNLEIGPVYAFRARFDSIGAAAYLIHTSMPTHPDVITVHAALDTIGNWSIGHAWGWETWPGEVKVGP
ncbi:MAG TPA: hypothetical protein VLX68_09370 [Chitinivibrionales bacterium]|nr:hypothetical protein [Chitinivibrionales bacterium]